METPISKTIIKHTRRKLNRKLSQAIGLVCSNQKKDYQQLIQQSLSKNLFVVHFGNGDHKDQAWIEGVL